MILLEGTHARDLGPAQIPEAPQAITADLSFISLRQAPGPALSLAANNAWAVLLAKPQFESGPNAVAADGVVRDLSIREKARDDVIHWLERQGWELIGSMESPITGKEGNREYLVAGRKTPGLRLLD